MGMEEEVQCQYLQRVEVHADLKKNTNNLKTGKKRTILKEVFMKKNPTMFLMGRSVRDLRTICSHVR